MTEHIHFEEFRCSNCLGMESGEPTAYVNNSGWCKGCVLRLKHWWAWFIPPKPNEPLKMYVGLLMVMGYSASAGVFAFVIGRLLFGAGT